MSPLKSSLSNLFVAAIVYSDTLNGVLCAVKIAEIPWKFSEDTMISDNKGIDRGIPSWLVEEFELAIIFIFMIFLRHNFHSDQE